MDAFSRIENLRDTLTAREQLVADSILDSPESYTQSTSTMAAQHAGVSQSTISRFCQKLGYESYTDFRMELTLSLSAHTPYEESRDNTKSHVDYLSDMITATNAAVRTNLDDLVDKILSARTIYTTGAGLSSTPALSLSLQLLKFNLRSTFVTCGSEMVTMHVADASDLVLIFSSKNDTHRMFLNVLQDATAQKRPHTIMVTHTGAHPLRNLVDETIVLPTWQSERYPVYIEPTESMQAFSSIVMLAISEKTGRNPVTYSSFVNGRPI
jgi:DNA-binding MurR/RpiR family transcriptional regulator